MSTTDNTTITEAEADKLRTELADMRTTLAENRRINNILMREVRRLTQELRAARAE